MRPGELMHTFTPVHDGHPEIVNAPNVAVQLPMIGLLPGVKPLPKLAAFFLEGGDFSLEPDAPGIGCNPFLDLVANLFGHNLY